MSSDKMRAEFEQWAEDNDCGITLAATSATGFYTRNIAWTAWQAAYQAGRMAELEAIQREKEEWSKAVNKRWIETRTLRGGE